MLKKSLNHSLLGPQYLNCSNEGFSLAEINNGINLFLHKFA